MLFTSLTTSISITSPVCVKWNYRTPIYVIIGRPLDFSGGNVRGRDTLNKLRPL